MRPTPWTEAEKYRKSPPGYESGAWDPWGAFVIPFPATGGWLRALACDGRVSRKEHGDEFAWDHVSVSVANRVPTYAEMCFVKSLFWGDDETVMHLYVPATEHINVRPNTLHLWKPLLLPIPRPPAKMV